MKKFIFAALVTLLVGVGAKAAALSASTAGFAYSTINLTTSLYITLLPSLTKSIKALTVSNTGANAVYIAVGAAGSEVNQIAVPPLTAGATPPTFPLVVSQGQRISVIASTGTISSGSILINAFFN